MRKERMKYRHRHVSPNVTYELVLSEADVNGVAVYYEMLEDGNFAYRLFRSADMVEVAE